MPIVTAVLLSLVLGAAFAFHSYQQAIFEAARLSNDVPSSPGEWWRLVAASFVHGDGQVFTCLSALALVGAGGWKCERSFGSGAALLVFLVGGACGNVVRCLTEPAEWLEHAGTGGLAGGFALAAAAAAVSVRSREKKSIRGLSTAGLGVVITLFFASIDAAGSDPFVVMKTLLPGVLVGYVAGGVLGTVLPLRSKNPPLALRSAIFVAALAVFSWGAVGYGRAVLPAVRPIARGEAPAKKSDPFSLAKTWDEKLGLEFGVPRALRKQETQGEDGAKQAPIARYAPWFGGLPQFVIQSFPRHPFDAPDTRAVRDAQGWIVESGGRLEHLRTGEGWIENCPLGRRGYRVALRDNEHQLVHWLVVLGNETRLVMVQVFTSLDDEKAQDLVDALARSLNERKPATDK